MNSAIPSGKIPAGEASSSSKSPVSSSAAEHKLREAFRRFSSVAAACVGSPWAFIVAAAAILVWAILGPIYHFSDTWQLVINTGTTIITFLMVFLIQNTQNRDARAIHLKLDELIRGLHGPRNKLVDLEDCSEEELQHYEEEFRAIRERRSHEQSPSNGHQKREPVGARKASR